MTESQMRLTDVSWKAQKRLACVESNLLCIDSPGVLGSNVGGVLAVSPCSDSSVRTAGLWILLVANEEW